LNVRSKTIKLEENKGKILDINLGNDFFFWGGGLNTKNKDKIFGRVPHCPTPTRAEIQTLMERVYGCGPLDGGAVH